MPTRQAVKNHRKTFGRDSSLDVDVYVTNEQCWDGYNRHVKINYGTKGFLTVNEARRFHRSLGAAIRYADHYETKLKRLR